MNLKKNDIYFSLILLYVVKLIVLPIGFPDAFALLVLLSYRPVSTFLKLQEKQKISNENAQKFEEVADEIAKVNNILESLKNHEQIKQSFGMKK
jgi:hypothetical protein